jgi:hypothetical protein
MNVIIHKSIKQYISAIRLGKIYSTLKANLTVNDRIYFLL